MKVLQVNISNFRGIRRGVVNMRGDVLLIGENNIGKSTICAALELVLGVERLDQSPVIEEYDFYNCRYLNSDEESIDIRVQVVLTNLSKQEKHRFRIHLRLWDDAKNTFTDGPDDKNLVNDGTKLHWVLPVIFIGKYNKNDFTFSGATFFDYPIDTSGNQVQNFGVGRTIFGRENKILCGFIFLGPDRSASQLLGLNNGSLLGRILLIARESKKETAFNQDFLLENQEVSDDLLVSFDSAGYSDLHRIALLNSEVGRQILNQAPSTKISNELHEIISPFINLASDDFAIPVSKLGTATTGLILIELLKTLSELKGKSSVSLIIDEPELALLPRQQRQLSRIISSRFAQTIVVTNSVTITENFDLEAIVALDRHRGGAINGLPLRLAGFESQHLKSRSYDLSQTLFSSGVLVVESGAVAAAFCETLVVLERLLGDEKFASCGFAGISIFNAQNAKMVPRYAPLFSSLKKTAFAFYDMLEKEYDDEANINLDEYVGHWQSPTKGFVNLLVSETAPEVHRRFLEAADRLDSYPRHCGTYDALLDDNSAVCEIVTSVLHTCYYDSGFFTALLIRQCRSVNDIPQTIRQVMFEINAEITKNQLYNDE